LKILIKILAALVLTLSLKINAQGNDSSFNEVEKVIDKAIEDKSFPGAVVLIWKDDKILFEKAFGYYTYDTPSAKVQTNTIFDLASLTKVVATTTAAMICYDRKLFSLDDRVMKFIPEFGINGKENITLKNLLLHNSGLPAWKKFYGRDLNYDEVINEIYSSELEYKTGKKTVYSDLGVITLGKVIEKVTGKSLDLFCREEIFIPLKMINTFYNPPDSVKKYCMPTENDNYWRMKTLQGEVHDETSAMLNGVAGHAGLFSTAEDISKLMAMLMQGGMYDGNQIIKNTTIELFTRKYSDQSTRAIGWDTKSETGSSAGDFFSLISYGHTGFTGTSIWADPDRNLFVIFLTNRVYPTRENLKILNVRPALHNAVIKSVENR
jgi:CubicO group peptidase (beta-lactamase class C family)